MTLFRRKRLLGKLVLVASSLSLSLLVAEVLLREIIPMDTGTSVMPRVPHPTLGWVLEPHVSYRYKTPEATAVPVTLNSRGWRDGEHTVDNTQNLFRALVLGDSFMEAYSVELNEAFHRRVEALARQKGHPIEVINLGVGGYGTLQEYLAFRERGQVYKPNLVLLGFYLANDVRNNSLDLESMLNPGSMKVTSRPFLGPSSTSAWRITQTDFAKAQRLYATAQA